MNKMDHNLFEILEGAYAPATLRAYKSDWAHFLVFCEAGGMTPLPACHETIVAFLESEASFAVATVERRLYSIRKAHALAGHANPCQDIGVELALRRLRRSKPNRPGQALGIRDELLGRMIDAQPHTLQGTRDRALLAVGFDFLTRRSELSALRVGDVKLLPEGTLRGTVRRGKSDQYGLGRTVFGGHRAGKLLREWLASRPGDAEWLFCPVRGGQTYDRPLCTSQIKNVLKASARLAGLTDEEISEVSGHSLRVGAAQELMARGADISTIMRAGGWKTVDVVARYVRYAEHNVWV